MSRFSFGPAAAAVSLLTSGLAAGEDNLKEQAQVERQASPITKEQTNAASSISLAMVQLGILSGGPEKQIVGGKEVSVSELKAEVRKNYPLLAESQKAMLTKGFPGLSDIVAEKTVPQPAGPEKEQKKESPELPGITAGKVGQQPAEVKNDQAEAPLTGRQQSAGITMSLAMINIRLMKDSGQEKTLSGGQEVSIHDHYAEVRSNYPLLSESQQKNFNKEYPELKDIIAGKVGQKPAEIEKEQAGTPLTEQQRSAGVSVELAMLNIGLMNGLGQERLLAGGQEVSIQEYYADVKRYYPLLSKSQQDNFKKEYPELPHIIDGTIGQFKEAKENARVAEEAEKLQKAAYTDCAQSARLAFLVYEPGNKEQNSGFHEQVKQFNESFMKLPDNLKDKLEKEAFDTPYQDALQAAQQKVQDKDQKGAESQIRKAEILSEFNLIFKMTVLADRARALDVRVNQISEGVESLGEEIDARK